MNPWSNANLVSKTPLLTVLLLENGNVQQLWRMWSTHTSAGQSVWGWASVFLALLMWCNFYRVCCPKEKFALWTTALGCVMNAAVIATVIHFRVEGR